MSFDTTSFTEWLTPAEFDEFLERSGTGFIFKHSTRCGVSSWAHGELARFAGERPEVPIYLVLAVENRPLSTHVQNVLEIRHASPQAILVRDGKAVWDASHGELTAEALTDVWDRR